MDNSIGWGIVGLGIHVEQRFGRAFRYTKENRLVAVCSRSLEKAQAAAQRYGASRAYGSLDEMLRDPALDALYIATPNNLHAGQTIQAARAGKHVLCEKPMALTESDCESMIEVCAKNGVKLGVVFQNRYHPAHIEARRLFASGEIGAVSIARAQYGNFRIKAALQRGWRGDREAAGAGALMGTGLHPIDLLRYLLGSEVVDVRAWCEPAAPKIDEVVHAILRFANGACGTVVSGAIPFSDNDAVLYGEKAKVLCKGTVGMPLKGELWVEDGGDTRKKAFAAEDPDCANYVATIEAFGRSIQDDVEPDISGREGMALCRIARAILDSAAQGRTVPISH